jgi:hypothetical protein
MVVVQPPRATAATVMLEMNSVEAERLGIVRPFLAGKVSTVRGRPRLSGRFRFP